jgi:hypothetical protein
VGRRVDRRPGRAARGYIADLGWTGFAFGATVGTVRAAKVPLGRERRAWIFIFLVGCVAFLAGHDRRLAIYALLLDVSAAVLTMLAGVALYVSDLFAPEMIRQPATIAVAYPILYVAATGAALSMFWGCRRTRPAAHT